MQRAKTILGLIAYVATLLALLYAIAAGLSTRTESEPDWQEIEGKDEPTEIVERGL